MQPLPNIDVELTFRTYYKALYQYGMKLCGSQDKVQDSIRKVFVSALCQSESVQPLHLKSHSFAALRRLLNQSGYFNKVYSIEIEFTNEELKLSDNRPEKAGAEIANILNRLSRYHREVVYLKYVADLTYSEIETVMSIPGQDARKYFVDSMTAVKEHFAHARF